MPWNRELTDRLLREIEAQTSVPMTLMEVCGSHTMAIARSGIRSLLPEKLSLLSGPGCPVCVTGAEEIDKILELAMEPGLTIASYGDMLRVPGSVPGDSLQRRRALGAKVEVVYSAMDALELAAGLFSLEVLGIRMWDYRDEWMSMCANLICPRYTLYWFLLSGVAIFFIGAVDYYLLDIGHRPVYRMFRWKFAFPEARRIRQGQTADAETTVRREGRY